MITINKIVQQEYAPERTDVGWLKGDTLYFYINGKWTVESKDSDDVKYTPQSLTDSQKQQAKTNIGLGNVDNTSDVNKPISTATQTALNNKVNAPSTEGTNGQVLTTDGNGGRSWSTIQVGGVAWGNISGNLDSQTDLANVIYPTQANVNSLIDDKQAEPNFSELPLLCGQPSILFGNGTPAEAVVPDNWRQFADGGYNWNGLPSALGQQYINYAVSTGGRYIAVKDGYGQLKWLNM